MRRRSRDCLRVWEKLLAVFLMEVFVEWAHGAEYPMNLAAAQIPNANLRAPRLASLCTKISPTLVPFCSHVTYPVFSKRLLSDSEWNVSIKLFYRWLYLMIGVDAIHALVPLHSIHNSFSAPVMRFSVRRHLTARLLATTPDYPHATSSFASN